MFLLILGSVAIAAEKPVEKTTELPYTGRTVPIEFAEALAVCTPEQALAKVTNRGIRVLHWRAEFGFSSESLKLLNPDEKKNLASDLQATQNKFLAQYLSKGNPMAEGGTISQDTIVVATPDGKLTGIQFAHELLHQELFKLGPSNKEGIRIFPYDQTTKKMAQFRKVVQEKYNTLNMANLSAEKVKDNAEGYDILIKSFYLKVQNALAAVLDELDIHMLMHQRGWTTGGRIHELRSISLHLDTALKLTKSLAANYRALIPYKEHLKKETVTWGDSLLAVETFEIDLVNNKLIEKLQKIAKLEDLREWLLDKHTKALYRQVGLQIGE